MYIQHYSPSGHNDDREGSAGCSGRVQNSKGEAKNSQPAKSLSVDVLCVVHQASVFIGLPYIHCHFLVVLEFRRHGSLCFEGREGYKGSAGGGSGGGSSTDSPLAVEFSRSTAWPGLPLSLIPSITRERNRGSISSSLSPYRRHPHKAGESSAWPSALICDAESRHNIPSVANVDSYCACFARLTRGKRDRPEGRRCLPAAEKKRRSLILMPAAPRTHHETSCVSAVLYTLPLMHYRCTHCKQHCHQQVA